MKRVILCVMFALSGIAIQSQAQVTTKDDGEFITVSGKATDVTPKSFKLKTNTGSITVEMDDRWGADGWVLKNNDEVVVTGRVDHDFLETKKIEAGSVYVKNLKTTFFSSSKDEEGAPLLTSTIVYLPAIPEGSSVDLQGKVTKVSGREFTVDTGLRMVTVDTSEMLYNPTDNKGYTKINVGDRVRVSGEMEKSYIEGKEVSANFVTELM